MAARQSIPLFFAICSFAICHVAIAQPDPSGIQFVMIGDAGNANWIGEGRNNGRGSVGYEFKIEKFEVTTSQWVEFMNAAFDRPADDRLPFVRSPNQWGAVATTPQSQGGSRWMVPAGREMIPTGGITWRTAALYCNWLHNGKSSERSAFFDGAYDITTFSGAPTFRDQLTRSPGAQYWIPSLDEWMKAAHWDPNRNGEGEGGWWTYSNGSDERFVYGPPGALVNGVPTTANAGWDVFSFPGSNPFAVPLGAYASESPFGLRDAAGGTSEWTEEVFHIPGEQYPRARWSEGTPWEFPTNGSGDRVDERGGSGEPGFRGFEIGLRIASIPTPATLSLAICSIAMLTRRRRANSRSLPFRAVICSLPLVMGGLAAAQPDPSGIDFVTIGDPGNPNWTGGGFNNNRGAVGYEFKIGRFEVTTAQWVEFMNAAFDRPTTDRIPHVVSPFRWGAVNTPPTAEGGRRWAVGAGRDMWATGGINWRTAAIYCNWLHNNKSTDRAAFLNGAYDVSTFGYLNGGSLITDQLTRNAGARYWIPSVDEWMKAAHWDPNRNGEGVGGWWEYSNGSDNPYTYGPPGELINGVLASANSSWDDFDYPGLNQYAVPLGAYEALAVSPWGLLDVAGATSEWTEGYFQQSHEPLPRERLYEGTSWGTPTNGLADTVRYYEGGAFPSYPDRAFGLRIASAVPAPSSIALATFAIFRFTRKRRARV